MPAPGPALLDRLKQALQRIVDDALAAARQLACIAAKSFVYDAIQAFVDAVALAYPELLTAILAFASALYAAAVIEIDRVCGTNSNLVLK